MFNRIIFRNIYFFVLLFIFAAYSCKVDEFKWNDLGIKEGWSTKIIVPLFYGDMEFRDFITDWNKYEDEYSFNEPLTTLKYKSEYYPLIPTSLIFTPSVIIDSFPLLIQGNYELDSISLEFIVTNSSPYPLNLELVFFNKLDKIITSQPVSPESFDSGIFSESSIESVKTTRQVNFTPEQINSFNNGNRVRFTSWYTNNGFVKDTLFAHYPIEVSIILTGAIKNKNVE